MCQVSPINAFPPTVACSDVLAHRCVIDKFMALVSSSFYSEMLCDETLNGDQIMSGNSGDSGRSDI